MAKDTIDEKQAIRELLQSISVTLQEELSAELEARLEAVEQGKTAREATDDLLDPAYREIVSQMLLLSNVLRLLTVFQQTSGIFTPVQFEEIERYFTECVEKSFTALVSAHLRDVLASKMKPC
jgi:uncharacterized protein YjgD (DUF1641 family)